MTGDGDDQMAGRLRVAYTLEQCWHRVPGGSATSALAVAAELARRDDVELIGVAGRHRHPPQPAYHPAIPIRSLPYGRPALYETWNRFGWPPVERVTGRVDVCHSTVAIPAATRAPHLVTVHDVAFVRTPQRFTAHGVRVMRAGLERARRADLVLCPSQATIDDLVGLGFDPAKLRLVPWGVAPNLATDADRERVASRYSLPERFALFVGTVEPRKNLARLAAAARSMDDPMPLVVAGSAGWGDVAVAESGDVRFLGFVPADDLPAVYSAATVFAYPSLQEGFGLPILEAMAAGTPVVTSAGSATGEVAAGAAVLVDPLDVGSIADGLTRAERGAASLVELGRRRASTQTWSMTAEATVAAYREVAR